jgi:hypothetical protein
MVDTKIYNPKTKRLINTNGILAKKIYKEHINGLITLNPENVIKMKSQYPIKSSKHIEKNIELISNVPIKIKKKYIIKKIDIPIKIELEKKTIQSIAIPSKSNLILKYLSEFSNIQEISTQGTSKIYNGYLNNEKYFIKEVIKSSKGRKNEYGIYDIELACNELLASKLYKLYNVDAIDLYIVMNDTKSKQQKYMVASKSLIIDSCEPITKDCKDLIENKISGAIEPLLVDCILANWDIGSRGNVGIIDNNGKKYAFRIDVGGALLYRAMGAPRVYSIIPNEHENFFILSNKGYKLFKNLNSKQISVMFNILSKVNIENFDKLHDDILEDIKNIPQIDFKKAEKVLKVIEIVKKRHLYYLKNKSSVKSFLKSKILS